MASEFLERLKKHLDTGTEVPDIKKGFSEIIEKADKYAESPETMKQIQQKAEKLSEAKAEEVAKTLTADEVFRLNENAKKEQEKIDKFEEELKIKGALKVIQSEIEFLESKIIYYKSQADFLNSDASFETKNKVIEEVLLNELNS